MAKRTMFIPAEENEQIVKYNSDAEVYEIDEKHIIAAKNHPGGDWYGH